MTIRINSPISEDDEEYYEWLHAQHCNECFVELLAKEMAKPLKD